jgi:hypothetical protein
LFAGAGENHEQDSHDIRIPDTNSNRVLPKYKSTALPLGNRLGNLNLGRAPFDPYPVYCHNRVSWLSSVSPGKSRDSTKTIRKVTSDELLLKQAKRKTNLLYTKTTCILKLLLNVVTVETEALVSWNKFLYACVKYVYRL